METERWLPVVGYELRYEVSSWGRVRSKDFWYDTGKAYSRVKKGRVLKLSTMPHGYISIGLTGPTGRKTLTVHRLVAEAFIPNPDNLRVVHHIDADKSNNRVINLHWCSYAENLMYTYDRGDRVFSGDNKPKLNPDKVRSMRSLREEGETVVNLSSMFGVSIGTVSDVCSRLTYRNVK